MIVKILIAVLIFGITVIIHELGHFLLAKANGITVTEFSIGFGPTVVKTEKGGTVYSLKLLPFGGACQMLGEDGEEEGEGTFNSKSVWARISVVAAGPVFNMILAFFCAIFVISYAGSSPARVTEVADGSPEAEAGLEAGDIITSYEGRHISIGKELNSVMTVRGVPTDEITLEVKKADGEKKTITYEPTVTTRYMMGFNYDDCDRGMEFTYVQQNMPLAAAGVVAGDLLVSINGAPITCVADFTAYQTEHPFDGSAVTLEYEHSGKTKEITVTPVENTYANVQFSYQLREKQSPIGVLKYSVLEIKYWVRTVIDSVSMLITGQYSVNDLSGPVGVVDAIGTAYDDVKSQGVLVTVMTMLNMVILLSSNLGVMNLLPLPALDGGRLVFLIIEGIHGLNPRLTPSIPDAQKFRIYISCFTSVAMDNLSRIATTDNRLLRRLTRDYRQRGADALATLSRWASVRRGEEKHIFPYQENADVMLNSSLFYEISVLRPFAEKILREVPDTVPEYDEARRMLKFLDNFIPIPPDEIPPTSILREFIGGSSFQY